MSTEGCSAAFTDEIDGIWVNTKRTWPNHLTSIPPEIVRKPVVFLKNQSEIQNLFCKIVRFLETALR